MPFIDNVLSRYIDYQRVCNSNYVYVCQCITPVWVKEEITIVYISLNGVVPTTSEENVKSTNSNSVLDEFDH